MEETSCWPVIVNNTVPTFSVSGTTFVAPVQFGWPGHSSKIIIIFKTGQ